MQFKIKIINLLMLVLIAYSCNISQRTTAPRNLERIYDPSSSRIHPQIKVHNYTDSTSLLIELLKTKELLFNQANSENKLLSQVRVIYNLYDLNNRQSLVDSSTTTFKFEKDAEKKNERIEIEINSSTGNNYLLEVITTDLNRNSTAYSFLRIDRTKENGSLDYIFFNKDNDKSYLDFYLKPEQHFGLKHYKKNIDSLFISFFEYDFSVPLAPYKLDTLIDNIEIPDTNWVCYLDSINYKNFNKEGIYYFSESENQKITSNGLSLFNFGNKFPVIRTPEELAKPLEYLGGLDSTTAYDSTGKLLKLAIDNFWLEKANNMDKSRELVKAYYNRVMLANKYFTSYKKGWQTDRGMIYIVYGLPDYLFKSGDEERWIYNPQGIGTGIEFSFKYKESPFTYNHFVLDRDKIKVTGWDDAIEMWNKGEIIYFQKSLE